MKLSIFVTLMCLLLEFGFSSGARAESNVMRPTEPFQEIIRSEVQPEFTVTGFSSFAGKSISMYVVSAVKNPLGGTPLIRELLAPPVTKIISLDGSVTFQKMTIKSRDDSPYNTVILLVHENVSGPIYPTNPSNDVIIDHSRTLNTNEPLPQSSVHDILLSRYLYRNQILKLSKSQQQAIFTLGSDL